LRLDLRLEALADSPDPMTNTEPIQQVVTSRR